MRKRLPYLLIYLFLLIFILQIAGLIVLFLLPEPGQAAAEFKPQVSIPGSGFTAGEPYAGGFTGTTKPIAEYIRALYKYAIGFVGILATVVMMFGGINWIIAGGSAERIGEAKAWIGAALTGLVLALSSYMILNTINPDLVNFKLTEIKNVESTSQSSVNKGCCDFSDGCANSLTETECKSGNFGGIGEYKGLSYTCDQTFLKKCILNIENCSNKQEWDLCYIIIGGNKEVGYCENGICQHCKTWGTCGQGKDYMCCDKTCNYFSGC